MFSLNNISALLGTPIKRGAGLGSKLTQAVQGSAAVSALNLNYSDSGLFGFVVAGPATEAGKAVKAAVNVLKSTSVDDAQLSRAKALLKADLLMAEENTGNLFEDITLQALINKGGIVGVGDLIVAIDAISAADVNAASSKVASGKLAVAALGNLSHVPYADEL